MEKLEVYQFDCLDDNFGVLVHDPEIGITASIDAPDEDAINAALAQKGWTLSHILVTHHHFDHVDGIQPLKAKWGAIVVANADDARRIPGIDIGVKPGDYFSFGLHKVDFINAPGHTIGHLILHFCDDGLLFTGDTLFSLGCGRMFEGSADEMWQSMQAIKALPGETMIWCGHEYTKANADFAATIETDNEQLQQRIGEVSSLRAAGKPTLPVSLASEMATNPFLRADKASVKTALGMADASDVETFAEIRKRKDNF